MSAPAIIAWGAVSPLGTGESSVRFGRPGEPAVTRVARDPELDAAGLRRPWCARARLDERNERSDAQRDRATLLIQSALDDCARRLDEILPGWRALRVGLAVGTSSGGMRGFERHYDPEGTTRLPFEATYLGPVLTAALPVAVEPFALVLGACASGTLAIGLARAWLASGACDLALAGGFDAVSTFVASGFESMRATSSERGPRPFRRERDGLSLGEGAAVIALLPSALVREHADSGAKVRALAYVTGFGASCDAVHLTAPDKGGAGLARAAARALSGDPDVDLVSAHGTATVLNDAAEAQAISAATRGAPYVHACKGVIGHTLGAAGALETLAALDAIQAGVVPASYGEGESEPGARVVDGAVAARVSRVLKLSAAFGGSNAALVLDANEPNAAGASRRISGDDVVSVSAAVAITGDVAAQTAPDVLATKTGYPEDRIARADLLTKLTLAAVASLDERHGLRDAKGLSVGVIVGLGLATIETNARFLTRIREAGAARAEPRRFPYTTPNACAGEAAVAFGLTGPSFAVGGGPHGGIEALAVASTLVRAGLADRIVVVVADEIGPASHVARVGGVSGLERPASGAVALLVAPPDVALDGRMTAASVHVPSGGGVDPATEGPLAAHLGLLPLVGAVPPVPGPQELEVAFGTGGFAKARFFWL